MIVRRIKRVKPSAFAIEVTAVGGRAGRKRARLVREEPTLLK